MTQQERSPRQRKPNPRRWRFWLWGAIGGLGVWGSAIARAQDPATPLAAEGLASFNGWQAIALGIVQGLTEFLPISSTAHLKAVPVALGWGDPGVALTAVLQLGSIAAVISYFWSDLATLTRGSVRAVRDRNWQDHDFRITLGIALGTLPIIMGGLIIKIFVPDYDNSPLRSMGSIAIASIVMAALLGLAEVYGTRKRQFEQLDLQDGLWMGLAQALAIIPGVSRSGSTLTAGLGIGIDRAAAARFSFLLGIPAITIAGLVELVSLLREPFTTGDLGVLIWGLLAAGVSSYAAIAWLLRFLQTQSTWVFVIYRLVFGVVILGAIAAGWLPSA